MHKTQRCEFIDREFSSFNGRNFSEEILSSVK